LLFKPVDALEKLVESIVRGILLEIDRPEFLWRGTPRPEKKVKPGTFMTDQKKTALDYVFYGANQWKSSAEPGYLSKYLLASSANLQRFMSFQEAYEHYNVKGVRGKSTLKLAKKAVKRKEADIVVVYEEWIVVNPGAVKLLDTVLLDPKQAELGGALIEGVGDWSTQVFSDDTGEYLVGDILSYIKEAEIPLTNFAVEDLVEINLAPSPEETGEQVPGSAEFVKRAEGSSLNYPIIVVEYPDGRFIADGVHRLWKAFKTEQSEIKGYLITSDELEANVEHK